MTLCVWTVDGSFHPFSGKNKLFKDLSQSFQLLCYQSDYHFGYYLANLSRNFYFFLFVSYLHPKMSCAKILCCQDFRLNEDNYHCNFLSELLSLKKLDLLSSDLYFELKAKCSNQSSPFPVSYHLHQSLCHPSWSESNRLIVLLCVFILMSSKSFPFVCR